MKRLSIILATLLSFAACSPFQIYVSPDGNDGAAGRRKSPLATVSAALDKSAEYAVKHPGNDVEIIFADGVYPVTETVTITGSLTESSLTLRAAEGAKPVFSAEKPVSGWQKVSDADAIAKLPCPEKVLQADLKANGVTDLGKPIGDRDRFDLYYNGKRQTLAMWPNEGFSYAGVALGTTPYVGYLGIHSMMEPIMTYVDPHIDSWGDEKEPCLHGYWQYDWAEVYNTVVIDTEKRIFDIRGEKSTYGYKDGCRFRGVNLLRELDAPGEFWVDREKGLIFWYAPEGFSGEGTAVSAFSGDFIFVVNDCFNVTFEGLEMCGSRGGAVAVNGGGGIIFDNCTFKRFANTVIKVDGGYGHKFTHCLLSELGCAGIIIDSGNRKTLEPSDIEVCDCTIESLSLYHKTYQPCIGFKGCGLYIYNNLFRDCPSSALRLDGNDVEVVYNVFEDLVLESDDQGGIDIFNNYGFRGITICHNYFHNIGDPKDNIAGGVRFDDRISGMLVESNVFNHCGSSGFGGVQIHGGQDNVVKGNVFFDCTYAVSQSPWPVEMWFKHGEKDRAEMGITPKMDKLTPMGKIYLAKYPEMAHMLDSSLVNRNYILDNLVVRTPQIETRGRNLVIDGNTFIPDDTEHDLAYWVSDEVLAGYGIDPVGFDKMGPRE